MKYTMISYIIVFCGLGFVAIAAPFEDDKQAKILKFENESDGKGNYKFSFETSNGINRKESGEVINEGQPNQHIYVHGYISFPDADGEIQEFRYVADENGYTIVSPSVIQSAVSPNVVATLLG